MAMEEHLTPEERLEKLISDGNAMITNGNALLIKLRKTLNGFLYVGVPVLVIFVGSYWHNNNRMTTLETTRMTDKELQEKFASKDAVVFLQNDVFDLNNAVFKKSEWVVESDVEKEYIKALKQFTGDITRGATN